MWRRNLLVWRKLAIASVLGNIADPLLYMLALGYGIGSLVGEVGGMSYVAFIGTGMVCQSAMFTASFEGMYSAFSRMHVQRTWEGIINAPISLDDVMLAEWLWAATKAVMSTTAILAVIMALGYGHTWLAIWVLPLGFVVGLTFGAAGLVMNALAPNYDFFTYFFTLVLTPMLLFSGVYFPVEQMPRVARGVAELPAAQARDRPRAAADAGPRARRTPLHVAVLLVYAALAYYVALVLTRRRLLKYGVRDGRALLRPLPARAGRRARRRARRRCGGTAIAPTDGGVGFEGDWSLAYRANLESRIASRILWRVGGGAYRDEHARLRARHGDRLEAPVPPHAHAARRRRRDAFAAAKPRVRHAARQGRRVRPAARRPQRAAFDRQARARRAGPRLPDRPRRDDLRRHVGRAAVQARLPARRRGSAAAREPGGRPARADRLDAGRRRCSIRCAAAARSSSRPR